MGGSVSAEARVQKPLPGTETQTLPAAAALWRLGSPTGCCRSAPAAASVLPRRPTREAERSPCPEPDGAAEPVPTTSARGEADGVARTGGALTEPQREVHGRGAVDAQRDRAVARHDGDRIACGPPRQLRVRELREVLAGHQQQRPCAVDADLEGQWCSCERPGLHAADGSNRGHRAGTPGCHDTQDRHQPEPTHAAMYVRAQCGGPASAVRWLQGPLATRDT